MNEEERVQQKKRNKLEDYREVAFTDDRPPNHPTFVLMEQTAASFLTQKSSMWRLRVDIKVLKQIQIAKL